MRFVIVTGLSGTGKTQALRCFEDLGYFCMDNFPPTLLPKFAELSFYNNGELNKIALVMDTRSGVFFEDFYSALDYLKEQAYQYQVLYLEADDDALVKRFKESKRNHPLSQDGRIIDGISKEREILAKVIGRDDNLIRIDTSNTSIWDLRQQIIELFDKNLDEKQFKITIISFGFKNGIPSDSDLVFDVRFLPNPFYVKELRNLSGNDDEVRKYVESFEECKIFFIKLKDFLKFLMPNYIKEGKNQLIISIGCTGGRHRSVSIANKLAEDLKVESYLVSLLHRDIEVNK
ncbi:MAG: RNase adapter RapZ [Oscillospiraceae bacterium]|nr:RNase adapter RapZ [Oscillospiraceae bacterium]